MLQQFINHVMKNLTEKKPRKFKDHCYYKWKYQGVAHSVCNLKFKEHRYILLIAHISSGFDNQLILLNIAEKLKECNFFVLAKTLKSLLIFFCLEKVLKIKIAPKPLSRIIF